MISLYNMVAYAVQYMKNREVGLENMQKQGLQLPDTEAQLAYVPFYHASKLPFHTSYLWCHSDHIR